jgi:hypothetical protein
MSHPTEEIKVDLSPAQQKRINQLACVFSKAIDDCELTNAERLGLLVVLCAQYTEHCLTTLPGAFTVEGIADSLRTSLVRTWKLTAERRDQ